MDGALDEFAPERPEYILQFLLGLGEEYGGCTNGMTVDRFREAICLRRADDEWPRRAVAVRGY